MASNLVKFETDSGDVELSAEIVRQIAAGQGNLTPQEIALFIKLCQYQHLNPFLREVYLIKYGNEKATMVTGKEVFTKRAAKNPRFDGFEAGITVVTANGEMDRREGALLLKTDTLIAGWARVYLKGTKVPVFAEASFDEYAGRKRDGSLNQTWSSKPATMIRKVALVQSLREAFPEDLQGLYDAAEMQMDSDTLPTESVVTATAEVIEDAKTATKKASKSEAQKVVEELGAEVDAIIEAEVVEDDGTADLFSVSDQKDELGDWPVDDASQEDIDVLDAYGKHILTATNQSGRTIEQVWLEKGSEWFDEAIAWAKSNPATVKKKGLVYDFMAIEEYAAARKRVGA